MIVNVGHTGGAIPPLEKGRSVRGANRVGIMNDPHPNPPPFRGRERTTRAATFPPNSSMP